MACYFYQYISEKFGEFDLISSGNITRTNHSKKSWIGYRQDEYDVIVTIGYSDIDTGDIQIYNKEMFMSQKENKAHDIVFAIITLYEDDMLEDPTIIPEICKKLDRGDDIYTILLSLYD